MVVACGGDAIFVLSVTQYEHWNLAAASGRGTQRYNSCRPNCAAGHLINRSVQFRLFKSEARGGQILFGCLVLDGGTDETYPLLGQQRASSCALPGHIAG